MKIAINGCFGGASLSKEAYDYLGIPWDGYGFEFSSGKLEVRTDPKLIEVIEVLGKKANGESANWCIVTVPDDVSVFIDEYDGWENVQEAHRVWEADGSCVNYSDDY